MWREVPQARICPGYQHQALSAPGFAGGVCDGFVVELNNSGTAAIRGTYLGTSSADQVYGIETDKFGFIYVMGTTEGTWKVINAAYSNQNAKQFISKLKPDLSDYVYSTVFGSSPVQPLSYPIFLLRLFLLTAVKMCMFQAGEENRILVLAEGNTRGMPTTPDAIKPQTDASGSDFYFFVLKKDAASQLYGSFFGQEDPPLGVNNPVYFWRPCGWWHEPV